MSNPLVNKKMQDLIQRSKSQQIVFRWGVTIATVTLGALGYWSWAWLVLALGAFGSVIDIGLALVIGQVAQAATSIAVSNKKPGV